MDDFRKLKVSGLSKRFGRFQALENVGFAISYDSEAILKYFADRRKIDFPLLADSDSKIIRAYEVLNVEATGQFKNMARPGYFFIE